MFGAAVVSMIWLLEQYPQIKSVLLIAEVIFSNFNFRP